MEKLWEKRYLLCRFLKFLQVLSRCFGESTAFVLITVVVSFSGMILGIYCLIKVQENILNGEF